MKKKITISQAWEGNADCLHCAIRSSALFSGLTADDFENLHEPVGQVTLAPGSVIYREGDKGKYLFTVRSGLVKLVQNLPDGSQRIVRLAATTDVLGLEILVSETYAHEAIVLHEAQLCRYPRDEVNTLSQHNPVLHKDLMARWQRALDEADLWLTRLTTGPAKKRVANLLLRLADPETSECYLFGREDVGSILNITIETASRIIAEFKREGVIEDLHRKRFRLNMPALEAIASE
ncbi:MAG TPA: Crp/Fnr family transcriptional regulator [Gammaproteobacteria bacterium]|nr:Crp/Fnr family transcriptional regulator [Gammaproteobacteria bacterium]